MKALVYFGSNEKCLVNKPRPEIEKSADAIVKITKTTICGTDLHILKGDVPTCEPGRILGHEGVGIVEEVGSSVSNIHVGDHVLISCITSCAKCDPCRKGMYSHCTDGGWILGHTIDGTQAEYVRIPHADTSLYKIPDDVDEESVVMLSDILPTAMECGVLNGKIKPGDSIAIVGAGPIGLATIITARLYSPTQIIMVDVDENRLGMAETLGATDLVHAYGSDVTNKILELTEGRGVDVAIEAVGIPSTFELCQDIIAAGGTIANIGVHGSKADIHLETLWSKNITIATRLVDTVTTPMLLKSVRSKKIELSSLITHRFTLDDIEKAYETFGNAAKTNALKVIITAN